MDINMTITHNRMQFNSEILQSPALHR